MRLLNGPDGFPYFLETEADEEIETALAEVPDDVLLAAYAQRWTGSGLTMPPLKIAALRKAILADWRKQAAPTTTRLLPVSDAAKVLGIPPTTLRLRISEHVFRTQRLNSGVLAVEVPSTAPRRHVLIPEKLRPDPRLVRAQSRKRR
jgi:hypothetical protein